MAMIDYQCEECGYRWEEFHHSDPPPSQRCSKMWDEPCLGYAPRVHSLPGEYRPTSARRFKPIVIWQSNDNPDQFSFPGSPDDPVDAGYHKIEIESLPQADYWTKRINDVETAKASNLRTAEREYWDAVTKERRDGIRAKIGSNPRAQALFRAVQKFVDAKRERRYNRPLDARAHFQVISFDSSNRQGHSGPDTNWHNKKV